MTAATGAPASGIVVGVDDSVEAAHAYQWAVARSERFGPVTPVASWQYPWWYYIGAPMIAPDGPGPDIERDAGAMVDALVSRTPPEARGEPIVARGPAGRVLVDVAENSGLLVVGTRGRGALADQVLGSVSSYCAAHSPVPVVVVPQDHPVEATPGLVLVGVDGSPGADAALDWAIAGAADEDRIVACRTWEIPVITGYEGIAIDAEVVQAATVETAERSVAAACERAGVAPDRVDVEVAEGDARMILENRGADADVIVVGRRGHGRLTHALLGSVTTSLVHRPVVPIAVVPPTASP
jgi:nucleotide-binding universal stress UspA family protein